MGRWFSVFPLQNLARRELIWCHGSFGFTLFIDPGNLPEVWLGHARSHKAYDFEAKTKWLQFYRKHFQNIILYKNTAFFIRFSPKFFPDSPIYNKTRFVQMMDSCPIGDGSLFEPMMVSYLLTHICVSRCRLVHKGINSLWPSDAIWRLIF